MPQTMISLVSRQIWPQILAVVRHKPVIDRLVLLHTNDRQESAQPAERLKALFSRGGLLDVDAILLCKAPHDDFEGVIAALDGLGLDPDRCLLNFTGGNKLMATAAFAWANIRRIPAFYIERNNILVQFRREEGRVRTETSALDPHATDFIDPVSILGCQLGNSRIVSRGEMLTLNEQGRAVDVGLLQDELRSSITARGAQDCRRYLKGWKTKREPSEGMNLEYATACVILKHGVPRVACNVELSPTGGTRTEGELDLVFNWAGRLWIVDCKDQIPDLWKVNGIRKEVRKQASISDALNKKLDGLLEMLTKSQIKVLREDIQQTYEAAGIMGQVICVRSSRLPDEAVEYARSRGMIVIGKDELSDRLRDVLNPTSEATPASLASLKQTLEGQRDVWGRRQR